MVGSEAPGLLPNAAAKVGDALPALPRPCQARRRGPATKGLQQLFCKSGLLITRDSGCVELCDHLLLAFGLRLLAEDERERFF